MDKHFKFHMNKFIEMQANEFIAKHQINTFPIDCLALAKKLGYKVLTYNELALKATMSVEDIKVKYSKFGFVFWSNSEQKYIICYNNSDFGEGTIRWTLMHEIAHIVLGHISKSKTSALMRKEKKFIELEADCFVKNILCPKKVVNEMGIKKPHEYKKTFGISWTAARLFSWNNKEKRI